MWTRSYSEEDYSDYNLVTVPVPLGKHTLGYPYIIDPRNNTIYLSLDETYHSDLIKRVQEDIDPTFYMHFWEYPYVYRHVSHSYDNPIEGLNRDLDTNFDITPGIKKTAGFYDDYEIITVPVPAGEYLSGYPYLIDSVDKKIYLSLDETYHNALIEEIQKSVNPEFYNWPPTENYARWNAVDRGAIRPYEDPIEGLKDKLGIGMPFESKISSGTLIKQIVPVQTQTDDHGNGQAWVLLDDGNLYVSTSEASHIDLFYGIQDQIYQEEDWHIFIGEMTRHIVITGRMNTATKEFIIYSEEDQLIGNLLDDFELYGYIQVPHNKYLTPEKWSRQSLKIVDHKNPWHILRKPFFWDERTNTLEIGKQGSGYLYQNSYSLEKIVSSEVKETLKKLAAKEDPIRIQDGDYEFVSFAHIPNPGSELYDTRFPILFDQLTNTFYIGFRGAYHAGLIEYMFDERMSGRRFQQEKEHWFAGMLSENKNPEFDKGETSVGNMDWYLSYDLPKEDRELRTEVMTNFWINHRDELNIHPYKTSSDSQWDDGDPVINQAIDNEYWDMKGRNFMWYTSWIWDVGRQELLISKDTHVNHSALLLNNDIPENGAVYGIITRNDYDQFAIVPEYTDMGKWHEKIPFQVNEKKEVNKATKAVAKFLAEEQPGKFVDIHKASAVIEIPGEEDPNWAWENKRRPIIFYNGNIYIGSPGSHHGPMLNKMDDQNIIILSDYEDYLTAYKVEDEYAGTGGYVEPEGGVYILNATEEADQFALAAKQEWGEDIPIYEWHNGWIKIAMDIKPLEAEEPFLNWQGESYIFEPTFLGEDRQGVNAYDGTQLVGSLTWSDEGDFIYLRSAYVDPSYRGEGLFKQLLENVPAKPIDGEWAENSPLDGFFQNYNQKFAADAINDPFSIYNLKLNFEYVPGDSTPSDVDNDSSFRGNNYNRIPWIWRGKNNTVYYSDPGTYHLTVMEHLNIVDRFGEHASDLPWSVYEYGSYFPDRDEIQIYSPGNKLNAEKQQQIIDHLGRV